MKRTTALLISLLLLSSMSACSSSSNSSSNNDSGTIATSTEQTETTDSVQSSSHKTLANKMTKTELAKVDKHALTLLDEPEQPTTSVPITEIKDHKVSVEMHKIPCSELSAEIEKAKAELSEAEYQSEAEFFQSYIDSGKDLEIPSGVLVDGKICSNYIPYSNPKYDGGTIKFSNYSVDPETQEAKPQEISFENMDEYIEWIRNKGKEQGKSDDDIETSVLRLQIANDALKDGNYEILPEGSIDLNDLQYYDLPEGTVTDFRSEWEYDRDAVEAIKDYVDEISIYDEELDISFTVHVTLPPDYDKDKTYPVFFLTDGIWRFGNHPELRKVMENGEAAPVILVSMWYSYKEAYNDGQNRYYHLVIERDKLLDFLTDNLMPYLSENYNIDFENSTLYGHSDGGVFTHNALFKSDKYDNQPFGNYIIGSPAFFGLYNYNDVAKIDSSDFENNYGYFDRNDKLNKHVFLCAGSEEDPDYKDSYNGHDSTLEGVAKLKEKLESHGVDFSYKLYDSHHYQYVPEMLIEYLKEKYPS